MATEVTGEGRKNPNSRFIGFDMNRAKVLNVTKDEGFSITLFKEVKIMFDLINKTLDPHGVNKAVLNSVNHVISLTRTEGIQKFVSEENEISIDKTNVVSVLLIPFSKRQDVVIQSLSRMIENLNKAQDDVKYKMYQKNIASFNIDQKKQSSDNIFMKGFLAGSHETVTKRNYKENSSEPTITKIEKNVLRAQTLLSNFVWNTGEQVKNILNYSRYSLCINRLNIYDCENGGVITNTLPFKKSFKVIVYQISDKHELIRNNVTISLKLNENLETKRKVAVGVFLENVETVKEVKNFEKDIFYENRNFLLTENPYLRIPEDVPEVDIIKNDLSMIQEDIFAGLTFNNPEEPKKGGKKTGKKKEKKVVKEEQEECSFNDVGTLCDVIETEDEAVDVDDEETIDE